MKHLRLALLFGGRSTEHEISIISAKAIAANLDPEHYTIIPVYITRTGTLFAGGIAATILQLDLPAMLRNAPLQEVAATLDAMADDAGQSPFNGDFAALGIKSAFLALHGAGGEDGTIQGYLETCRIPFTGCGVAASAITMDKALTKLSVAAAGIAVAPGLTIQSEQYRNDPDSTCRTIQATLDWPIFIKPARLGSSIGITKVHNAAELRPALDLATSLDWKILVETTIRGREIEVAICGNSQPVASICGEIEPVEEFYDFNDKYIASTAKLHIPARIPEPLQQQVRQAALTAYNHLGCKGMARIDFFVDETTGAITLNEVNTIPGFTDISMYPRLMAASGIPYPELLDTLITLSQETTFRP